MSRHNNCVKLILLTASVMLVCMPSYADDDFRQWLQREQSSFQQYKDERDKEFTEFLKTQWKEMELLKGFRRDESPKPVVMPVARPQPVKVPKPILTPEPRPVFKTEQAPQPVIQSIPDKNTKSVRRLLQKGTNCKAS